MWGSFWPSDDYGDAKIRRKRTAKGRPYGNFEHGMASREFLADFVTVTLFIGLLRAKKRTATK